MTQSIQITSHTNGQAVTGVQTITGTSTQSVGGTALTAQSYSITHDFTTVYGAVTLSIVNSTGDVANVVLIANQSADNTPIYGAGTQLVSPTGDVWTLASGVVYRNSVAAGTTSGTTILLLYGGNIYYTNGTTWYEWVTNAWSTVAKDPRPFVESSNLATVTNNTATLVDSTGAVWSLNATGNGSGNVVYQNSAIPALGNTNNIVELVYSSHLVYYVDTHGDSYYWDGSTPWNGPHTAPVTPPASPSGSYLWDTTGQIVDGSGNVWTFHNAGTVSSPNMQAYKNGAAAGNSNGGGVLLYYNGNIYTSYIGSVPNTWWEFSAPSTWTQVTGGDPRGFPASPFWGVNGHLTWSNSPGYVSTEWPTNVQRMRDLGMTSYRNGYGASYSSSTGAVTSSDGAAFLNFHNLAPDIILCPVLLPQYATDWTGATATESTAYTLGYNLGVDAATHLKNIVPWYEVGNEFDGYAITGGSGYSKSNYDNTKYLQCRGSILGMIAGIRSVDTTTPIAWPGGTWVHLGFFMCLMDGSTPSAQTTYDSTKIPVVQLKSWHMYLYNSSTNDNFQAITGQGLPNNGDFFACLQSVGGNLPLIITEYGTNTVNSSTGANYWPNGETSIEAALTTSNLAMDKFYAIRNSYTGMPIIACHQYQLADAYQNQANPNMASYSVQNEMGFGLTASDGSTEKGRYAVVKSFVQQHSVAPTTLTPV